MKMNLSLTANPAQCCALARSQANMSPFMPLVVARTRASTLRRIPPPAINARPVLRGDRHYLRALRAAEMAAWQAGHPFVASQFNWLSKAAI